MNSATSSSLAPAILAHKVAIITGASSGIGWAAAKLFARSRARPCTWRPTLRRSRPVRLCSSRAAFPSRGARLWPGPPL